MHFKFAARTILELGKDLISSDDVALYELIKNGVDAGSPAVRITAQIVLTRSVMRSVMDLAQGNSSQVGRIPPTVDRLLALIDTGKPENVDGDVWSNFRSAFADLKDLDQFLAAFVDAYRRYNWLEVADTGEGMSLEDLSEIFLQIGTRSRREQNNAGGQYLGDKGVGRLSAMRLGERLSVRTTRAGDATWHGLEIDWTKFSHDVQMDVADVVIDPFESDAKDDPQVRGTRIRISDLQGEWNMDRFGEEILQGKIARMIDPFEAGAANKLLTVYYNKTRVAVPSIPTSLLKAAHASASGELGFDPETGDPVLTGSVNYLKYDRERAIDQRGAEVYSLSQEATKRRGKKGNAATKLTPIRPDALKALGPFKFDVYWFNRRIVEKVPSLTERPSETRELIARWAGGPMLYRYGYRILPYGEPQDDWLELDSTAFGEAGFKLNRQQVIGRVRVWSPHTALSEQTNRQGLVDSEPAAALRQIMRWILHVELRNLINEVDKEQQLSKRDAEEKALAFRDTQQDVRSAVDELRGKSGPETRPLVDRVARGVDSLADQCAALVERIDAAVKEVEDEREKFVYLAGIGLMTEFIFHELDRSVGHTLRLLADTHSGSAAALRSLESQLTTLQKRISAFDELTGERRQAKSAFDIADVVNDIAASHANEFARHGIEMVLVAPSMRIKAVRGMVIQILENLIANAVYWLKQQKRYEPDLAPTIWVTIDPDERSVSVEDNGLGVSAERREVIFQPFITSKPAAQGRGLGLYISRELAEHHDWQLYLDIVPSKIRPGRLNKFVLDMGG